MSTILSTLFAADYPFLDVLWTMIIFFAWVIWIWIVITVLVDLFRRHDIGGWGKAAWVVFVIVLPYLGVLIYLIGNYKYVAYGDEQQPRADRAARRTSRCRNGTRIVPARLGSAHQRISSRSDDEAPTRRA